MTRIRIIPHFTTSRSGPPPPTYLADAIVEKLLDLQTPIVVALDDFHLAALPPVTEFIAHCCENVPEAVHLVLLTRERPALPLSLWHARNWLNEFAASDLAFSIEETLEFFASVRHAHLATQEIESIQRQTEGWPAGLRMVELSRANMQSHVSTSDVSLVDESNAMCFLAEQVLEAQSVELRRFFGLTASLDRFCAPLCDELLTGTSSSQSSNEIIRELERKNLFLVSLDQHGEWYRYHHLFRQLLRCRSHELLAGIDPQLIAQKAGRWFAQHGTIEAALSYLNDAGDLDAAAELV